MRNKKQLKLINEILSLLESQKEKHVKHQSWSIENNLPRQAYQSEDKAKAISRAINAIKEKYDA